MTFFSSGLCEFCHLKLSIMCQNIQYFTDKTDQLSIPDANWDNSF